MLLHSHVERHVILFGPASQWVQQQNWFSETSFFQQPASRILQIKEKKLGLANVGTDFGLVHLHEKGVSVVNGVAELEGKNGISAHRFTLFTNLVGCESVLVQTVVPPDPVQNFQFAASQPVTALVNHLRMTNSSGFVFQKNQKLVSTLM